MSRKKSGLMAQWRRGDYFLPVVRKVAELFIKTYGRILAPGLSAFDPHLPEELTARKQPQYRLALFRESSPVVWRSRSSTRNAVGEGRKIGVARRALSKPISFARLGAAPKSAWAPRRTITRAFLQALLTASAPFFPRAVRVALGRCAIVFFFFAAAAAFLILFLAAAFCAVVILQVRLRPTHRAFRILVKS